MREPASASTTKQSRQQRRRWQFRSLPNGGAILTHILDWLQLLAESNHTSALLVEYCVAWTMNIIFTVRYIVDYVSLKIHMARLRKNPQDWWKIVPLCAMARTRVELDVSVQERWNQLIQAIRKTAVEIHGGDNVSKIATHPPSTIVEWSLLSDQQWSTIFHSSLEVRRQASYLMYKLSMKHNLDDASTSLCARQTVNKLLCTWQRLWPKLLEFPPSMTLRQPCGDDDDDGSQYRISVIVPVYKETLETLQRTLLHALKHCERDSQQIQVILVHASTPIACTTTQNLHTRLLESVVLPCSAAKPSSFGDLQVVEAAPSLLGSRNGNGGRGRTLNAGIPYAEAPILTFLHADTLVPQGWDVQIGNALRSNINHNKHVFPQACAFTMGIDMEDMTMRRTTPGLRGAEWQGILRCHCGLPYGDSVLSFTKSTLAYIGGYPEQPLMEDYELMDWLRVRSMLEIRSDLQLPKEQLILLRSQVKCSPRRWQKYGVAYTSFVNALCIYRYRQMGVPAEELFDLYYHSLDNTTNKKAI